MPNRTCFLIDDDEDDREIFEMALGVADSSCTFISAKNGVEALKHFEQDPGFIPDFIFIDLNMPYMTGKECLAAIKQVPRLTGIPAIIYTTSSYNKDAEDAKTLGAAHFLVKPASISALTSAIGTILEDASAAYYLNTVTAD